jgi:hypothetical protein
MTILRVTRREIIESQVLWNPMVRIIAGQIKHGWIVLRPAGMIKPAIIAKSLDQSPNVRSGALSYTAE